MSTADATAAAPAAPMSFRDVLRIEVMRRVWYAQVISLFGDFLALFAVIVVVSFAMHGTPNQITGVQIAYMLPIVFVGPIAGVFVDRWPLKPTLVASDLIRAVLAVLLIPEQMRRGEYSENHISGLAMNVIGPEALRRVQGGRPVRGAQHLVIFGFQLGLQQADVGLDVVDDTDTRTHRDQPIRRLMVSRKWTTEIGLEI